MAYAVVPRANGTPPPNWPIGFDRAMLRSSPVSAATLLLTDYGLVPPAPNNLLLLHIGTAGPCVRHKPFSKPFSSRRLIGELDVVLVRAVLARLLAALAEKRVTVCMAWSALAAGSSLVSGSERRFVCVLPLCLPDRYGSPLHWRHVTRACFTPMIAPSFLPPSRSGWPAAAAGHAS